MWRKTLLAGLVAIKLVAVAAPAMAVEETDLSQVRAIVEPSIVYLDVTYSAYVWDEFYGAYVSPDPFVVNTGCTGFVVNPNGYIMTAGHCVDTDAGIRNAIIEAAAEYAFQNDYYEFDEGETRADVRRWAHEDFRIEDADYASGSADVAVTAFRAVSQSGSTEWKDHAARVVEVMEFGEGDLALLKAEAKNLPALELAESGTIGVGSNVVTVGYAGSVEAVTDVSASPSYKDGTVSSERTQAGGLVPVYEVSAALSPGMSGGPAVDADGRVVGVNSFTITEETQAFNFISPVSLVAELMAGRNVGNELDDAAVAYRDGITALYDGDKEAAVVGIGTAKDAWGSLDVIDDLMARIDSIPTTTSTTITTTTTADDSTSSTGGREGASTTATATDERSGGGVGLGLVLVGAVAAAGAGAVAFGRRSSDAPVDHVGQLEQLKGLRDAGIISDSDFEVAKAQAVAQLTGVNA